jgi:hypothetical protein
MNILQFDSRPQLFFGFGGSSHSPPYRLDSPARFSTSIGSLFASLDAETETWGWNQSKEFSTRSRTPVASIWWNGLLSAILYPAERSIPKFTLFFKNSDEPMKARDVASPAD